MPELDKLRHREILASRYCKKYCTMMGRGREGVTLHCKSLWRVLRVGYVKTFYTVDSGFVISKLQYINPTKFF